MYHMVFQIMGPQNYAPLDFNLRWRVINSSVTWGKWPNLSTPLPHSWNTEKSAHFVG